MKHKFHFFMADIPLMFLVSILLLGVIHYLDRKVVMVSYQKEPVSFGEYHGDTIKDSGSSMGDEKPEEIFNNGSDLKDNGCTYAIKVNKTCNVVTVYTLGQDGLYSVPYRCMVCSVGATGNTPIGVFNLGDRSEWLPLEGDVYGQYCSRIVDDILFHSVPYFTQNKNDLEIEEYNKLGKSVSAGCVRLSVIDAKWIYEHCGQGTFVEIFESGYEGPMGKPVSAVLSSGGSGGNWDPTDPDKENPYMGSIPVILGAYDREIERLGEFDIMAGISALNPEGEDITERITVEGEVDTKVCGTYKITYKVKDDSGLEGSATANIIVKDEKPPVLFVDQKIDSIGMYDIQNTDELRAILLTNVTAYDGNKELDDDSVEVDYSEIIDIGYGKCNVKYQAKDSEGNKSKVVVLAVNVDLEAPTLSLKKNGTAEIRLSNMLKDDYMLSLIDAEDNSGSVEVTLSRPLTYLENEPYSVIYCAKDEFGNVSTLSVTYQLAD